MATANSTELLDRLHDKVRAFRTAPSLPVHFVLEEELTELGALKRIAAPKSQVLGCARILEALSVTALATPDLPYTVHVFCNLDALQQFNLIPTTTRYWAHALRRLGNDARHMRRKIDGSDADVAMIFAERCLAWYFCLYQFGPNCERLTNDGQPLGLGDDVELVAAVGEFERHVSEPQVLARQWLGRVDTALPAPEFASALAESLLESKQLDQARAILDRGLETYPDDLRLRQLDGLYYSRTGELETARRKLEAIWDEKRYDDETAGILAGVYKRLWQADNDVELLWRSYRYYRTAWNRSHRDNTYLGINTATTAMWLALAVHETSSRDHTKDDLLRKSQKIAEIVRDVLLKRREKLDGRNGDLSMNYWDQATLAEAFLLFGDVESAGRTYRDAIERHPEQRANIEVTRQQAENILRARGIADCDIDSWFS